MLAAVLLHDLLALNQELFLLVVVQVLVEIMAVVMDLDLNSGAAHLEHTMIS